MVVGLYDETDAYAPNPADYFFSRLSETNGTPGKPFYMPNGTPFFCTANGTFLKRGLADWDKLPAAERKPGAVRVPEYKVDPERVKKSRRLTRPPANALIVRTYVRGLKEDERKRLYGPKTIPEWYNSPTEANRDFLWLQEKEWRSLVPDEPARGRSFAVPAAVRDRICFWHLAGGNGYFALPGSFSGEQFRSREMTLTVAEATPRHVTMRLSGQAALKSDVTYRFQGVLEYDLGKKAFVRFDVLALCDKGPGPVTPNAPYRYYGVAFELSGERTDDLLPPFYLREHIGSPQRYFADAAP